MSTSSEKFLDIYEHKLDAQEKDSYRDRDIKVLKRFLKLPIKDVVLYSQSFSNAPVELFRFIQSVKFWLRLPYELKKQAKTMKIACIVFAIEGAIPLNEKRTKVKYFFENYLSLETKKKLLKGFLFGNKYFFGKGESLSTRHLMFQYIPKSFYWGSNLPKYCTANNQAPICQCGDWLEKQSLDKVNDLVSQLASKFYEMRCSVTHDASSVMWGHTEEAPSDYTSWSMTLVDCYTSYGEYCSYESGLSIKEIEDCLKEGFVEYYKSDSDLKRDRYAP